MRAAVLSRGSVTFFLVSCALSLLSMTGVSALPISGCDEACAVSCSDNGAALTSMFNCEGSAAARCNEGYYPSSAATGCEMFTEAKTFMDVCVNVKKDTPLNHVHDVLLLQEDLDSALAMYKELLKEDGVELENLSITNWVDAGADPKDAVVVSYGCKAEHRSESEGNLRRLTKTDPKVDADGVDRYGVRFPFDVRGGAVTVKEAEQASENIPYGKMKGSILSSAVTLNYGGGQTFLNDECDTTCKTCVDRSAKTCVTCPTGKRLDNKHSEPYGPCVAVKA